MAKFISMSEKSFYKIINQQHGKVDIIAHISFIRLTINNMAKFISMSEKRFYKIINQQHGKVYIIARYEFYQVDNQQHGKVDIIVRDKVNMYFKFV